MDFNKNVFLKFIYFMAFILSLQACSLKDDASDNSAKEQEYTDQRLQIGCKIDEKRVERILEIEIRDQISCIKKNIDLFLKVVRPESDRYRDQLSRAALEKYITFKKPEFKSIVEYLDVFFELSHLIFGDEYGYISKSNLEELTEFLYFFNEKMASIHIYLKDDGLKREIYSLHKFKRDKIIDVALALRKRILDIFTTRKIDPNQTIDILRLIDIFETKDSGNSIDKVKKLLFIKKYIVGGVEDQMNQVQLKEILDKVPALAQVAYDIYRFPRVIFQSELNKYELLQQDLKQLKQIKAKKVDQADVLITEDQLKELLRVFKDDLEIEEPEKYEDLIGLVQEVFIGEKGDLTFASLDKIIEKIDSIVRIGFVFAESYKLNQKFLDTDKALNRNLVLVNPYSSFTADPLLLKEFQRFSSAVKNYRFYKGDFVIPYFGNTVKRNVKGAIEFGIYEYLLETAFRYIEVKYPCHEKRFVRFEKGKQVDYRCQKEDYDGRINAYQLQDVILDNREILSALEIVTPKLEVLTAESAYLMTDLFQLRSNDDALIDIHEATEFALQVVSAMGMRENILSVIGKHCNGPGDTAPDSTPENPKYSVECFRRNFFKSLQEKFYDEDKAKHFTYGDYLPRLMSFYDQSIQKKNYTEVYNLIRGMESYTRTCFDDKIPMDKADILSVFGGIFSIESTILRFDKNLNNIMDSAEVDSSYSHFKAAVEGIVVKISPAGKPLAEQVFLYLIKNKTVPTTGDLAKFFLFDFSKRAPADRLTLASVLSAIKQNSDNKDLVIKYCEEVKEQLP